MKTLHIFLAIVMANFSFAASAQTNQAVKNDTVKVWGNCGMCQSKIEKAAKAAGATSAKWDEETHILSVSYNTKKATLDKIEKKVAAAGYDTEHAKADDAAYSTLPGCCKYDRKGTETKSAE